MKRLSVVPIAAVAALLMVGCERAPNIAGPENSSLTHPVFALHNTTNEFDIFWGDVEQNPCTGDMVTIAGKTHFLLVTTLDDGGGGHISSRTNSTGTGVGAPSLFTYNVKEQFSESSQAVNPGATIRDEYDLLILGPRSIDNYIKHMVFKYTIDNNGVPTATFENTFEKCAG